MERKYWYIKRSDIFSSMSNEEMERLAGLSTMCEFAKGAIIYLPDEPSEQIYLLKEGSIKVSKIEGKLRFNGAGKSPMDAGPSRGTRSDLAEVSSAKGVRGLFHHNSDEGSRQRSGGCG